MQMRGDTICNIVTFPMEINGNTNQETMIEELKEAAVYLSSQKKKNVINNIVVPVIWRENNN